MVVPRDKVCGDGLTSAPTPAPALAELGLTDILDECSAVHQWQPTGDGGWLADHGAELIVDVARLFTASATYDPNEDRCHLEGLIGPDEYHDGYPLPPGQASGPVSRHDAEADNPVGKEFTPCRDC